MDSSTSEILSKLKFITKIKEGYRIDTKYMCLQENTFFTRVWRTIFQDNRNMAFTMLKTTLDKAFEIIEGHWNNQSQRLIMRELIDEIKRCIEGLRNFQKTYEFDTMFCCEVETLIVDIKFRCTRYNEDKISEY